MRFTPANLFRHVKGLALASAFALALLMSAVPDVAAAKPAKPAQDPPITFTLVRDARPGCAASCPQWIAAQGRIDAGAAARFNAFLRGLGEVKRPVLLNSPGGSVQDAIAMGRAIRARGLSVVVAKTTLEPKTTLESCAKPCKLTERRGEPETAAAFCASACPLVFAGGKARIVSPLAYLGLHQISVTYQRYSVLRRFLVRYRVVNGKKQEISRKLVDEIRKPASSITRNATPGMDRDVGSYLTSMGVEAGPLLKIITTTPASTMHWLTYQELSASHISTSRLNGERMKLLPNGDTAVFDGDNFLLFR